MSKMLVVMLFEVIFKFFFVFELMDTGAIVECSFFPNSEISSHGYLSAFELLKQNIINWMAHKQ